MLACGRERSLGLFEVLARNRQSAVGFSGRILGTQEQPRVFTIPPRQRLPFTSWLVLRRRGVTRSRIRIRIIPCNNRDRERETQIQTKALKNSFLSISSPKQKALSSLSNPHASARKSVYLVQMLSFSLNDAKRTREKKRFIARYSYLSSSG